MVAIRLLAPYMAALALIGCASAPQQSPTAQPQPAAQAQPSTGDSQGANPPRGIAVGEPAPGERMMGGIQPAAPCIEEFSTLDANGDGAITLSEWTAVQGRTSEAFKAKDQDADGRIDSLEFCH